MKQEASVALSKPSGLGYRPDIDGMRAIAVLAVVIFHINKMLLPGGFVGVDIFFVISGYLISAHIFESARAGRFSFSDFYYRRIRRIAPAMAVVVLATVLIAQIMLLPDDARATAKSAVWSFGSMANVYFWLFQDTGYFAASSSELPLLHLWSLGVEEQFYLVWPVIAVVICRWRHAGMMALMLVLAAASFVTGQLGFARNPDFVYYMLPSRGGELLIGAMAAAIVVDGKLDWVRRFALPLAWSGLALLLASICFVSEDRVFPGMWALPPTCGAALLILGNCTPNAVTRLLGRPLLRRIGAISYSAYLWHWPLLAFYRYGYGQPGLVAGMAIFVLTMLLATLTYQLIELPMRYSKAIDRRTGYIGWFAGTVLLTGLSVGFVYADHLWPRDKSDYGRALAAIRKTNLPAYEFEYVCQRNLLEPGELDNSHCAMGKGASPASRVLLMGDSNAAHYIGIIGTFAEHTPFRFRNLEVGTCPPLLGDVSEFVDPHRLADCTRSQKVWREAIQQADVLILGATWTYYQEKSPRFLSAFLAQVREYEAMGKRVILLGKVPPITGFDRRCGEKALRYPLMHCGSQANPPLDDVVQANKILHHFADAEPNVRYFDIDETLCSAGLCSASGASGEALYFDAHHLSMTGSWELGKRIYAAHGVPQAFQTVAHAVR